jgi:hypothetical protein
MAGGGAATAGGGMATAGGGCARATPNMSSKPAETAAIN